MSTLAHHFNAVVSEPTETKKKESEGGEEITMKPEQETDIRTSADRVLQFRKTLLTLYTEDEDPFERLVRCDK